MNERELRFLLRFAADTGALRRTRDEVNRFAQAERGAAKGARDVQAGADKAAASVRRFGAGAAAGASKARAEFVRAGAAVRSLVSVLAAAGLGLSFAGAIQVVSEYGTAISRVQAITGELARTADGELNPTFAAVEETVRRLGATTIFTAGQSAEAFALLSQAGFSAAEGIRAVAGVLDLAVVGGIDLASSADIVANTVRSFGLAASESARVADVFAEAITSSNTNVLELGEALKFVGPVAASLGVSLEESAAAVGVLSDAGLKGTLAGTGLRRVLVGLTSQTPKAAKVLKAAGIEVEALSEGLTERGLIAAMEEFEGRTLSAADAVDVFGLRGGPAFLVLQDAAERAGSLSEALEEAEGRAEEFARVARDNLAGDLKLLRSVVEDTVLGTGAFNDVLREVVQTTAGVIQALNGTLDPLDENAQRYRELAQNVELAFDAAKLLLGAYAAFRAASIVQAVGTAASAFLGLGGAAGTAAGAVVGLRTAIISTGIGGLVIGIGAAAVALADMATETSTTDDVLEALDDELDRSNKLFERTNELTGELALQQLPAVAEEVKQLTRDLEAARKEQDRLRFAREALSEAGTVTDVVSSDQLTKLEKAKALTLGLLGAVIGGRGVFEGVVLASATRDLSSEQETLAEKTSEVNEELEQQRRKLARLKEVQEAEKALKAIDTQVEALGKSLAESGKVAAEFRGAAEKAFDDLAIEIGDLSLGTGREADLQRKVNAALRSAGLEVAIPVELELARTKAVEDLAKLERELGEARRTAAESGLKSGAATVAQAEVQVELAKRTVSEVEATIAARQRQREQLVGQVEVVRDLTEANERAAEAEKERLATAEKLVALDESAAKRADQLAFEVELLGLSDREREQALFHQELLNEAQELGLDSLTDAQKALEEQKRVRDELARTSISAGIRRELGNIADEGKELGKKFGEAVGGSIMAVEDQLKSFARTGKLEVRDLAQSILGEFIDLGVELAVAGVTDQIRSAFLPQQQSTSGGGGGGGASAALGVVGAIGGAFSGAGAGIGSFIGGFFSEGGLATDPPATGPIPASALRGARRFQFGGLSTGRDRIPAMLADDEAVVPLSRGRAIPVEMQGGGGGGTTINATFNIQTPDVAGFQKSRGQVESGMFAAMRRAAERNGERTT